MLTGCWHSHALLWTFPPLKPVASFLLRVPCCVGGLTGKQLKTTMLLFPAFSGKPICCQLGGSFDLGHLPNDPTWILLGMYSYGIQNWNLLCGYPFQSTRKTENHVRGPDCSADKYLYFFGQLCWPGYSSPHSSGTQQLDRGDSPT